MVKYSILLINSDNEGYVQFREVLYETIKLAFKETIFKGGSYEGYRIMKNLDKKNRYRLYNQRVLKNLILK